MPQQSTAPTTYRERQEAWAAKLRSGKVKQCREVLDSGFRRCCLGVAYDMAKEWHLYLSSAGEELETIFGMAVGAGNAFVVMNDVGQLTFPQIADAISGPNRRDDLFVKETEAKP